jgi:hypothetical protein
VFLGLRDLLHLLVELSCSAKVMLKSVATNVKPLLLLR